VKKKAIYLINDCIEVSLYILAVVCFLYFLYHGNRPKTLQPLLILVVLITIRSTLKITKINFSPLLRFSVLIFVFVAMFLAVEFDFYSRVWELDKLEHSCSGILLVFVGFLIFKHINRNEDHLQINNMTIVFFSLFFAIACAGTWEIFEYSVDKFLHLSTQNGSLEDTMQDIICGTTGAIITSTYLYFRIVSHDQKFILNEDAENILNEIPSEF
jgi:hypothetical protein